MAKAKYINGFTLGYSVSAKYVRDSDYHCENDYEIMYVRSGSRQVFVKDRSYVLTDGQLLFINKNELHKTSRINEKYERFVINFGDDYILPSVKRNMDVLFEHKLYAPSKLSTIDKLFFSLLSEWEKLYKENELAADNIKCYINILLTYFIRNHKHFSYTEKKTGNPSIERLLLYINENFKENITLAVAADMLHLSPHYLSQIFVKYTGFGFSEYLRAVRLEAAKDLLRNSKLPVTDVAHSCGFTDSNYFSAVFKKYTGISPTRYRCLSSL